MKRASDTENGVVQSEYGKYLVYLMQNLLLY